MNKSLFSGKKNPLNFPRYAAELGFDGVEYVNQFYFDYLKSGSTSSRKVKTLANKLNRNARDNDISNVLIMVDLEGELASQNNIKVILCSVLPAANFPWRKGKNPDIKIPLLNRLIKDYAKKKGFYYLDYYNLMNDGNNGLKKDYGNDGVHPNMNGYKLMQKMVLDAISNIL